MANKAPRMVTINLKNNASTSSFDIYDTLQFKLLEKFNHLKSLIVPDSN